MTNRFAAFQLISITTIAIVSACARESNVLQEGDQPAFHEFRGSRPNEVKIQLLCRSRDGEPDLDIAVRPARKFIDTGQAVTWRLVGNSTASQVIVAPSIANSWPFASPPYTVPRGSSVTTDAATEDDASRIPYKYSIEGQCVVGSDTFSVNLDPDVVVRGSGPRDSIGG